MNFYETVTAAVNDLLEHGYDSADRVAMWADRIRKAAAASMISTDKMQALVGESLRKEFDRMVVKGGLLKANPGVSRFTLDRLRPEMQAELQRRILASANLIKLNRQQAIERTLQRFEGWGSSVPAGGTKAPGKRQEAKKDIRKALTSLPFEERRVLIDQGHKFVSELNSILAKGSNAIAAIWRSHWRQAGYNYRQDHKERDSLTYAIRGNWAMDAGLMKAGPAGYTDEITRPAEEPFCRCQYRYVYNLRDLPDEMLTAKGREKLAEAKVAIGFK